MTPTLASRIAAFCELDKKRTQGEWEFTGHGICMDGGYGIQQFTNIADAHFVAASSQAADLMKQMLKDMKVMADALERAEKELRNACENLHWEGHHAGSEDCINAIRVTEPAIALYAPYRAIEIEEDL